MKVDTRKLLLRTFREYLVKHSFTVDSFTRMHLVNVDNFYTHAFKVFSVEAHQHLSPLYVESVLHNAGVGVQILSSDTKVEEYCYYVSEPIYQKLLTSY